MRYISCFICILFWNQLETVLGIIHIWDQVETGSKKEEASTKTTMGHDHKGE